MFNLSTLETMFLKFPLPYIAKAALICVLIIFLMMIEEKKLNGELFPLKGYSIFSEWFSENYLNRIATILSCHEVKLSSDIL